MPFRYLASNVFILPFPVFLSAIPKPLISFKYVIHYYQISLTKFLVFKTLQISACHFEGGMSQSLGNDFFGDFTIFCQRRPGVAGGIGADRRVHTAKRGQAGKVIIEYSQLSAIFAIRFLSPASSVKQIEQLKGKGIFAVIALDDCHRFRWNLNI